jgi:succinate dehydrogenase / fumarate reductase flavoprotein subunit
MHGANRLGGNSLSDLLVFGYLSGKNAAAYAGKITQHPDVDQDQVRSIVRNATDILNREEGENPYLLHEELEKNMQSNVGIIRIKEELQTGMEHLEEIRKRSQKVKAKGASQFNPAWHQALALRNLLITSEAVGRAALMREESRGAHTRSDFPEELDTWLKFNIVITKGPDGNMHLNKFERPTPDPELERIAKSMIDDLELEISQENKKRKV